MHKFSRLIITPPNLNSQSLKSLAVSVAIHLLFFGLNFIPFIKTKIEINPSINYVISVAVLEFENWGVGGAYA